MEPDEVRPIQPPELAQLLHILEQEGSRGILLIGDPASGKTTLLRMAEEELKRRHRSGYYVSLRGIAQAGDVGARILKAVTASSLIDIRAIRQTLRTSAGAPALRETIEILRRATPTIPRPVLLLDAVDEALYPARVATAVEELALTLDDWKVVIASRPTGVIGSALFGRFDVIRLSPFATEDAALLVLTYAPDLPRDFIGRIIEFSGGNPLLLRLAAEEFRRSNTLPTAGTSIVPMVERLIERAIDASRDPEGLSRLLDELAITGGRIQVSTLASVLQRSEGEVRLLLDDPGARPLLVLDNSTDAVALFHIVVAQVILSKRILTRSFRLTDLKFGAEEAERDELLDQSFVRRRSLEVILHERRSIIIGDRGSGKSAIFRKLATDTGAVDQGIHICPVANTGDPLLRIVDKDAWPDADALRAAWLVVVASVVAAALPESAPRKLRRNAAGLRAAFGFGSPSATFVQRMMRPIIRLLRGSTFTFSVGPVNLEAQLPTSGDGGPATASVDIESFLQEADDLLGKADQRVVVMFDRIDETAKYDRAKQETVIQALFQAEGRVSQFAHIALAVFLRTDLFELYDIQEKNKLVTRTLTLDWSEEEWLQVLVRRVLANDALFRIADLLRHNNGVDEIRAALGVLFPHEIEGQPVERWLIDSLRNGNGDLSPRLAVLLLQLTREMSTTSDGPVSRLPLFTAEAVQAAMTRLSDLSFFEIVNDFKVAVSFVLNCRAGKLDRFALSDVERLFDETEGKVSEQVRLLERLGFLERVVERSDDGHKSVFRIPRLYTRCWDY